MPIKLQVSKQGDDGEPADYLFEQDRIRIGRGSDNDLTLPDQKVSTQHAVIESEDGQYLLFDDDSKNHTYVRGERVGETEPYVLKSGDVLQVGDFEIEFVPLFMPSSEQTAYADPDDGEANPFEKHAAQLVSALEGLAETYTYAPKERRDDAFAEAFEGRFDDDLEEHQVVDRMLRAMGRPPGDGAQGRPSAAPQESASGAASGSGDESGDGASGARDQPTSVVPPPEDADAATDGSEGAPSPAVDAVLDELLESVARMISIPTHFWREFSGNTVVHPPEKAFIHRASVSSLREHLLDADLPEEERKQRLKHLREAVNTLVAHNVAMLAGYKKAVMAGSKDLLQKVNPIDAIEEAESTESGVLGGIFGGGDTKSELKKLEERWQDLYHGEWGAMEKEHFRPTYVNTYLERMAKAWGVDKEEIMEEK